MESVPTPWYRRPNRGWYITVGDKQLSLGMGDPKAGQGELLEAVYRVLREGGLLPGVSAATPVDPDAPVRRSGVVAGLVAEYRAVVDRRLRSQTGRDGYHRYLGWLVAEFGVLDVSAVRAAEVQERAEATGWSDATRRLCLAVVGGFMRWCGRDRFKLKLPPLTSRGEEVIVSPDEFRSLLGEARGDFGPALRFMHLTACRPGEMRTLTCEMVDWVNGVASWKEHKTKHRGKVRQLPLGDDALALLQAQREKYKTGHLFRNRSGLPFSAQSLKHRMRRLRQRAGVRSDVICYSARHTAITEMLEDGMSVADVAALSGHASPTMVEKVYSKVSANTKRLRQVASRRKAAG